LEPDLPAKFDGREEAPTARLELPFDGEFTSSSSLQGRVEGAPLADKLMKLECKGAIPVLAYKFASEGQYFPEPFLATLLFRPGEFSKVRHDFG
jgi:hypothetical protein